MTAHRRHLTQLALGGVLAMTLAYAGTHIGAKPWLAVLATGLCCAAWNVRVEVGTRYSPNAWTIDRAVAVALLLALGPWQTVLGVAVSTLVGLSIEQRGDRNWSLLAEITSATVPIAAGGVALAQLHDTAGHLRLPAAFPAYAMVVGAVVATSIALQLVLSILHSTSSRVALRDEAERLRALGPQTAGDAIVGAGFATVFMVQPWALVLLVPLGVTLFLSMRRGRRLEELTNQALESFANVVDERDPYTAQHSARVCDFAMRIGEQLQFSPNRMNRLFWTSRLHDLGKIAVDDSILNKPGKLTDEEFEIMKLHPVVSARILSSFTFDEVATDIVLCHHERYDGRGYLRRTRDDVPFEAYVIAVADSFDAMTSDRPYRKALPDHIALAEIERNLGTQFHPVAGTAFLELMGHTADGSNVAQLASEPRAKELGSAGVDRVSGETKAA
jgi:HD-GYP domain-containing protein (c-di-GMP phosphodiesterase class II)